MLSFLCQCSCLHDALVFPAGNSDTQSSGFGVFKAGINAVNKPVWLQFFSNFVNFELVRLGNAIASE